MVKIPTPKNYILLFIPVYGFSTTIVVEKDPILAKTNFEFDDEDEETLKEKLCDNHSERVKHFYCSNHLTVFCRECIKQFHSDDECFVVDLYEIQRMRQL